MTQFDYDVCIVGGGPAGVISAFGIAKAGFNCVILDKKSRDKIGDKNCGDALDSMHVELVTKDFGIKPPTLASKEARDLIKRITIGSVDLSTKFSVDYPGYLVDRLKYGQRLLKEAEELGVTIFDSCTVRDIIIENEYVVGVKYFDKNREEQSIRSKVTIDASGFIGVIRKRIPKNLTSGVNLNFNEDDVIATYREIIELKTEKDHPFREEIVLLYHEDIKPPGYAWIFSEGEKKLNIGITWVKSDPYPIGKSMKKIYHDCLDPYFDPSEYAILHKGGGNIPMRPNFDTLVFNGGLIVGDAGALADPTTFEGHGPAMESGRLAASTVVKALEKKDFSREQLWEYNKRIMDYPGGMHTQSYLAAKLLRKIGPQGLKYIIGKEIISEDELRAIFQEKNAEFSLLTKFKKFLKAFPKWGLMLQVKKHLDLIDAAEIIYQEYPRNPEMLTEWRTKRNKKLRFNF